MNKYNLNFYKKMNNKNKIEMSLSDIISQNKESEGDNNHQLGNIQSQSLGTHYGKKNFGETIKINKFDNDNDINRVRRRIGGYNNFNKGGYGNQINKPHVNNQLQRQRGIERRRYDRHIQNNQRFNNNNFDKFKKEEELTYRLLKIDNLNISMTNEDLRVSI